MAKKKLYEAKVNFAEHGEPLDRRSFYSHVSVAAARRKGLAARDEYRKQLMRGEIVSSKEKKLSFKYWAQKWLSQKEGTVKNFTYDTTYRVKVEKYIIPYFGEYKISDIKQELVQDFFKIYTNMSQSQNKKLFLILNSIFTIAIDNDVITKNPMKNINIKGKKPKEKKTYSKDDYDKLLLTCIERDYLDIVIILSTGIRRSELLGLLWDDISTSNNNIFVRRAVTPEYGGSIEGDPKSDSSKRCIPFSSNISSFIERHREHGYVIKGEEGAYMSPSGYEKRYKRIMKPLCEELNIEYLTIHELRHTYGTLLRANGSDIYTIQKALGHSSVEVTARTYVRNDIEILRRDMHLE